MPTKKTWFREWFNTPYYHQLYKHRNDDEAQMFMRNLVEFLKLPTSSTILDLACGKGRHSIFLNSLGYRVTGADLSENSILYAQQSSNNSLSFKVQDMREPFDLKTDAVFNLFTSFGYFENDLEDLKVLENIKQALEDHGVGVLDYMNVNKVIPNLVNEETLYRDNLKFDIQRSVTHGFITKDIYVNDQDQQFHFQERVKAIDLAKFKSYLNATGLKIQHIFGDYHLSEYNPDSSDRLILVFSK